MNAAAAGDAANRPQRLATVPANHPTHPVHACRALATCIDEKLLLAACA